MKPWLHSEGHTNPGTLAATPAYKFENSLSYMKPYLKQEEKAS